MSSGEEGESRHPHLAAIALRGAGLSGMGYLLAQGINLAAYVVLARLITPEDFGIFAAATALLGFTLLITESGLTSALVQWRGDLEVAVNTTAVASVVNGIFFGLLALATAPLLGLFFDSHEVGVMAAVMSGIVTLRILTVTPDALLQRRMAFLRRLVIEPAQVICFATASIIAAANDLGPWSLVIGQYAGVVIDVILSWGLARWRPRPRMASFKVWRELVGYGRHVLIATSILRAGEQSDSLIIGGAIGTSALGQFRYAFRVASTPFLMLLAAASYVLFPAFSRIADEGQRFRDAFTQSMRWMCIAAMPASLILLPLGTPATVVIFGDQWYAAGHAAQAMCLYTAGLTISSVVSEALKAHGRPDRLTPMHAITTIVTAGSMLVLTQAGLTWAAAAMSLGAIASAAYSVRVSRTVLHLPGKILSNSIIPPFLAALVMAALLVPVEVFVDADGLRFPFDVFALLGEGVLGAAIYAAVLHVLAPGTIRDAFNLVRVARNKRPEPEELPAPS